MTSVLVRGKPGVHLFSKQPFSGFDTDAWQGLLMWSCSRASPAHAVWEGVLGVLQGRGHCKCPDTCSIFLGPRCTFLGEPPLDSLHCMFPMLGGSWRGDGACRTLLHQCLSDSHLAPCTPVLFARGKNEGPCLGLWWQSNRAPSPTLFPSHTS